MKEPRWIVFAFLITLAGSVYLVSHSSGEGISTRFGRHLNYYDNGVDESSELSWEYNADDEGKSIQRPEELRGRPSEFDDEGGISMEKLPDNLNAVGGGIPLGWELDAANPEKIIKLNKGIDFVLGLMNNMFSSEGELTVDLPNLNKTFGHGIIAGKFEASGGFFKNPATLHRTGDVEIIKDGGKVSLEVALGLSVLEAGYSHYDLKMLKIAQHGSMAISVADNSLKIKLSFTYFPNCKLDVDYVELNELNGIKVDITGLGAFQTMFNMISTWLADNFTDGFKAIINQKLSAKAVKAVNRKDICKYFSF